MIKSILLAFLLPASLYHAPPEARGQDSLAARVDSIFVHFNQGHSPGAAVLVVKEGKILLRKGYGMANLEHQVPVTSSTVFDLASLSKQFAGMAIAMLIEEGRISPEEDIRKYIPELPDFGRTITVSHLIHHTSGLRDWPATLALAGWRMDDVISFRQILDMAYRQESLNFEPGSEYSYSNTGYNLLAELVQRVSGKSFREWTQEHIFDPLGMKNTHFHDNHTEVVPGRATGYAPGPAGSFRAIPNNLTALGSSSLFSSIDDLAKWVVNLDSRQVGGKAVLERMQQQGVLNSGKKIPYAFGLVRGQYRGLETLDHSGGWAAFNTFLLHFPQERLSVVVLMNQTAFPAQAAAYRIADIYLAEELHPGEAEAPGIVAAGTAAREEKGREERAGAEREAETWAPAAAELEEYLGSYESSELQTSYAITLEENLLVLKHSRHGSIPLRPLSKDHFSGLAFFLEELEFIRDAQGAVKGFAVSVERSRKQQFERIDL